MKKITLLICCAFFAQTGLSQSPRELLKKQTQRKLAEIINSSSSVTGMAALDLVTGDRFEFNQDLVFAQASAIKIPILMEVYKQASENKFSLTDVRPLATSNVVGGSGILNVLPDPVSMSIRNYCMLMIGLSDNSATNTLIELVGMQNINATMESLGYKQTRVHRRMIDQPASIRNEENISTPTEAVSLLKLLFDGKFINRSTSDEILAILAKNPAESSKLGKGIPSGIKIAFKPGGMGGVSTEWAIIYLGKHPYAVAVMENYKLGSANQDVFTSISKVLYEYFAKIDKATAFGVILE